MDKFDERNFGFVKCYNNLGCNFWSTDNEISKAYNTKMLNLLSLIEYTQNNDNSKIFYEKKDNLKKSYEILLDNELKKKYLHFMFINYVLSQPTTLDKLKYNFQNFVFPYYIFLLNNKSKQLGQYVILDLIEMTIGFYVKNKSTRCVNMSQIKVTHLKSVYRKKK
jgi:hypothetical protein